MTPEMSKRIDDAFNHLLDIIRQQHEALELYEQTKKRFVDDKDKRSAVRGFERKVNKALALSEPYVKMMEK